MVKKSIDRRELDKIVVILNMSNSEDVNLVNFVEITTYITMLNSVKHRKTTNFITESWKDMQLHVECKVEYFDMYDRWHLWCKISYYEYKIN